VYETENKADLTCL